MTNPFQPCPGVAGLQVIASTYNGDPAQNTLYFQKNDSTAWGSSEIEDLVNEFDTWLGTSNGEAAFRGGLSTSLAITQLKARDYSVDGGVEYVKNVDHAGLDAGAAVQDGLTFAFTLRTGLSGRSFRGRLFAFALTASWLSGTGSNTVGGTVPNDVVTGLNALVSEAAGWSPAMQWVVLSRRHKIGSTPNVIRASGVATPIVDVGYSNLTVDFQRRRAPYHSRHN